MYKQVVLRFGQFICYFFISTLNYIAVTTLRSAKRVRNEFSE
jgi:hypothetical protein